MGCDIHPHFEVKIKGEWKYYGQGNSERNYLIFSKLAGVRDYDNTTDKIDDPRGLPDDVTEMTKIHSDVYASDGHSHSWISSEEYVEVIQFMQDYCRENKYEYEFDYVYLFENSFYDFHKERGILPEFVEDFRMVFWFDN